MLMGLRLDVTIKEEVCSYWHIFASVQDVWTSQTYVHLAIYKDYDAYLANPRGIKGLRIATLAVIDVDRTDMYTALKLLPEFEGATDWQ
jgi:hypothetical protein